MNIGDPYRPIALVRARPGLGWTQRERLSFGMMTMKPCWREGFVSVLLQTDELKFHLLAKGYTDYDTLKVRLDNVLKQIGVL